MHQPIKNKGLVANADRRAIVSRPRSSPSEYPLLAALFCAVALPLAWAYQQPPLPAFFSQALAVALWSGVLLALAGVTRPTLQVGNSGGIKRWPAATPVGLWALLLTAVVAHAVSGLTPSFVAAPIALNLALAMLLSVAVGYGSLPALSLGRWLRTLLIGILIAALVNALAALVQFMAPSWADDNWIARMVPPHDRASGNLRQPNQLATLMVWGLLATSYLWRGKPLVWMAVSAPLLATLLATGSRTGIVSLLLIIAVALARSRRVRAWRTKGWLLLLLGTIPLIWFAENSFTRSTASAALAQRLALWRDVLEIISQHPWVGVGWGQLNFAWTLTQLPSRAADVFDHAHSLPLHMAAELGIPLVALLLYLLAALFWRARAALNTSDGATVVLLLATMLLHSLFEYPLWFSYFLLPSAFLLAWLVAAGQDDSKLPPQASQPAGKPRAVKLTGVLAIASLVAMISVVYATREYRKATSIHRSVAAPDALARAIDAARASPLFGHFGDYAAIMLAGDAASPDLFLRPTRHVLDERLLSAYARMLVRSGDLARAAFVVDRAREFPPDAAFANLPPLGASSPALLTPLTARDFRR